MQRVRTVSRGHGVKGWQFGAAVFAFVGMIAPVQVSAVDAGVKASTGVVASRGQACDAWFPDLNCDRSGRWDGFHMPIVAPYLFEDPFITTGVYPYYVYHDFPGRSALQGGEAHVAAVQIRVALTDRIALIATKDGRAWLRADNPLLDEQQGWLNLAGGLKAAIYEDPDAPFMVSGILRFEFDSGSSDVFQGQGDGVVIPSVAFAWGTGPLQVIGDLGGQIPLDGGDQTSSIFGHLYAGLDVSPHFVPFAQVSAVHWVDSGRGTLPVDLNIGVTLPLDTVQSALGTGPFEGADVWNLGSRGVGGLDLWTAALGFHVPITDRVTFSAAYERPFSHHKGVFQQRVTTALAIEF